MTVEQIYSYYYDIMVFFKSLTQRIWNLSICDLDNDENGSI